MILYVFMQQNYRACAVYCGEHGDLNIPVDYVSKDGLRIGAWIRRQRKLYQGTDVGTPLTPQQVTQVESIGMNRKDSHACQWDYGFRRPQHYYRAFGDINIPVAYVDEEGFVLGRWIKRPGSTESPRERIKQ